MERVLDVLKDCKDLTSNQLSETIKTAVNQFVDGAEQSDDLTLLTIRYRRPTDSNLLYFERFHILVHNGTFINTLWTLIDIKTLTNNIESKTTSEGITNEFLVEFIVTFCLGILTLLFQ